MVNRGEANGLGGGETHHRPKVRTMRRRGKPHPEAQRPGGGGAPPQPLDPSQQLREVCTAWDSSPCRETRGHFESVSEALILATFSKKEV